MHQAIFTVNENYVVGPNGQVPVGSTKRRTCCEMRLNGPDITCCGDGLYSVTYSATVTPATTGVIGLQVMKDGEVVPGSTRTGMGTAGEPLPISSIAMVRHDGCRAFNLSVFLVSPEGATTGATVSLSTVVEK
jgi:hypothetical protein